MAGEYKFTDPGALEVGGETEILTLEQRRTGDYPTFVAADVVPSARLRALKLTWPGERVIEILDLPEARKEGWEPVAWVWHGEEGSWREAYE